MDESDSVEQGTVSSTVEEGSDQLSETVEEYDSDETTCLTGTEKQEAFSILESFKIQQISGTEASHLDPRFDNTIGVLPEDSHEGHRKLSLKISAYNFRNRSLSVAKGIGKGGMEWCGKCMILA